MSRRCLRDDIAEVLVSEEQIEAALEDLARRVTADYADKRPLLVGVLTGAFIFMADLVRRLDFALEVDFVAVSSYGDSTASGELKLTKDVDCELSGRHVLVVDDIVDTGRTLAMLVELFERRGAAEVRTCCLLDKPARREVDFEANYLGLQIPDQFVVGYGLDYAFGHRNLPFVGVLRAELYEE
jgi:hypoxanthine phosphoribosyltransferase